jgi:hypothetical protein
MRPWPVLGRSATEIIIYNKVNEPSHVWTWRTAGGGGVRPSDTWGEGPPGVWASFKWEWKQSDGVRMAKSSDLRLFSYWVMLKGMSLEKKKIWWSVQEGDYFCPVLFGTVAWEASVSILELTNPLRICFNAVNRKTWYRYGQSQALGI